MLRTPPHILVTTPESLYLLLTSERSRADAAHRPHGHRRRNPRGDRHPPRRAPGAVARAPAARRRPAAAAARPVGDAEADRGRGALAVRRPTAAAAPSSTRAMRGAIDLGDRVPRSELDAVMSHEVWERVLRPARRRWSRRTAPRWCSSTRAGWPSGSPGTSASGSAKTAVTAHHGSLSKDKRLDAETRLKSGQLRALVATASLELGIDIGHVDLVCQIGSPHRIATLLQRVGRSGHTVARHAEGPRCSRSRATT